MAGSRSGVMCSQVLLTRSGSPDPPHAAYQSPLGMPLHRPTLPCRRMVMETIDRVVRDLGTADVDARLEELLIDGILYAFQEQARACCRTVASPGQLADCSLYLHPHSPSRGWSLADTLQPGRSGLLPQQP